MPLAYIRTENCAWPIVLLALTKIKEFTMPRAAKQVKTKHCFRIVEDGYNLT